MQQNNENRIIERLDNLMALLIPPFDELKYSITGIALEVLKYCDGENSADTITKKMKKPKNAIEKSLSKLRGMGLIKSITRDGGTYYIRLK